MSKVRVELNSGGVRQLLKDPAIVGAVRSAAERVRNNAGTGYASDTRVENRAVARVYAESKEAVSDNYRNNTLLKALHD